MDNAVDKQDADFHERGPLLPGFDVDSKTRLVEREAIFESVAYLREHGLDADRIQACLVRHFYVDLDLLNEALVTH